MALYALGDLHLSLNSNKSMYFIFLIFSYFSILSLDQQIHQPKGYGSLYHRHGTRHDTGIVATVNGQGLRLHGLQIHTGLWLTNGGRGLYGHLQHQGTALLVIDAAAAQNAPLPASAQVLPTPGPAACSIAQALFAPHTALALQHAVGRTSAEYVWAYPPGVPLLAPGEVITPEFITACTALAACGTHLHHTGLGGGSILDVLP